MSAEETLIQVRKDKHQELNGNKYPVPEDHGYNIEFILERMNLLNLQTSLDPAQLSNYDSITVNARISAIRKSGGITFIKLTDETGSIQTIASKAVLADYDKLKLLDLGDIIQIEGFSCLSKTGEKSLLITNWLVLTKSHRPPPEKFVGLTDQELKHRKRYLDLMSSEESRARFITRSYILRSIREYMNDIHFMEVETSTLNTIASGANAKPFTTHHNALDTNLNLRIAPELYLKRLLVGGFSSVYEIGRAYRNEGIDSRHNPEFTMMESYQAYGKFNSLIVFTKSLLQFINEDLKYSLPANVKLIYENWLRERPFSLEEFKEVPMWDAVIHGVSRAGLLLDPYIHPRFLGQEIIKPARDVELMDLSDSNFLEEDITTIVDRQSKIDLKSLRHELSQCTSVGTKIATLFEYVAEPFLTEDYRSGDDKHSCPVFITDYPKEICPLARSNDKAPWFCDRFELFIEGRELCNAFQELNDPDEQALRFKEQLANNQKDPMVYDSDYVEALEYGMPPAIGFGMGVDRLVMLLTNTDSIKDVILFPTLKPENNR